MAFCKACGQDIGSANFCPKCGANQSTGVAPAAAPGSAGVAVATGTAASPAEGVQENIAGLLCYLPAVGWLISIIFFVIDKRRFVKFHAIQSLGVHVAMFVVFVALGIFMAILHAVSIFFLGALLYPLLWLACFLLLLFLMYKAYLKEEFKVPVIGDFAMGMASK